MTPTSARSGRLTAAAVALLTATLVPGLAQLPAVATESTPTPATTLATPGDSVAGLADLDARGTALPTATEREAVSRLGAVDVRWNQFGTPASLLPADGTLGPAQSPNPVVAARTWLSQHASAFGLSTDDVNGLELVNDQRLAQSHAHAVLFRQRFGTLTPALDSMVTVGVARGEIAYVSSSITRTTGTPAAATLSPVQAWGRAAANVGRTVSASDLAGLKTTTADGWTRFTVPGFAQEQQARLRALAMADGSVRHVFEITDGNTKRIDAVAAMANSADDIVVKLFVPQGQLLVSGDLGTSPETASYTADSIPAGIYSLQVCPYGDPTVPFTPPGSYAAAVTTSDTTTPGTDASLPVPQWRYFTANPSLDWSPKATPGNSVIGCWTAVKGCSSPTGPFRNVAAPGPWDTLVKTGEPTLTTVGNNADTHEAWLSPDSPGGTAQAPVSPTRDYTGKFTDAWNNSRCDPTQLHPGG